MYLLACLVAMLVAMYLGLRAFIGASDIHDLSKRLNSLVWLYIIPAGLMLAPVMASMLDELQLRRGNPIAISTGIVSVALALLGALIVLAATVIDGVRHRTERGFGLSARRLVLAASASLVLVSAASHLMFIRDAGTVTAGTVTFEFFRDEVKDMHCEAGLILIRWDQSPNSPVQYRCPRGYMLNRHASRPFLPWPDYSAGYSADLAVILHEIMRQMPERDHD